MARGQLASCISGIFWFLFSHLWLSFECACAVCVCMEFLEPLRFLVGKANKWLRPLFLVVSQCTPPTTHNRESSAVKNDSTPMNMISGQFNDVMRLQ